MTRVLALSVVLAAVVLAPQGVSSAQPAGKSLSTQFTTDTVTFTGERVFDLGGPGWVYMRAIVTAISPDGETFADGNLGAHFDITTSTDGQTYSPAGLSPADSAMSSTGFLVAVGQFDGGIGLHLRYVKATVSIIDLSTGRVYSGSNHPTITVRLDVVYP